MQSLQRDGGKNFWRLNKVKQTYHESTTQLSKHRHARVQTLWFHVLTGKLKKTIGKVLEWEKLSNGKWKDG